MKAHPFMMVDTRHFRREFTLKLLASIENLDATLDGVCFHSENFQALQLMQERYREQVKCVYIDPPYNTGEGDFCYKDRFLHSSWLSMLSDRQTLGLSFLQEVGLMFVSIDDAEIPRLKQLMQQVTPNNQLAVLVWDRNRKNDAKYFSVGHEYMVVWARSSSALKEAKVVLREPREGLEEAKAVFSKLRKEFGEDWHAIRKGWLAWFEAITISDPRRRLMRYTQVNEKGPFRTDGNPSWPGGGGPRYEILHPETKKPVRIPSRGWVWSTAERFWEVWKEGKIVFGPDESTTPGVASYLFESEGQVMPSVFYSYAQTASQEFESLFGSKVFDNPKNWRDVLRVLRYSSAPVSCVLDYFAGSGTTGHSVINLNREDNGQRKYLLVEMGEYFDTVLTPRLKKVVYSTDWKEGQPQTRDTGISHAFKIVRLESYEDTLNNLHLRRTAEQEAALQRAGEANRDQYLLGYFLDVESEGSASLLDMAQFRDPFAYKLQIATSSAGETRETTVDLVETFNWLLGLKVDSIKKLDGFLRVEGYRRDGGRTRTLIIWRTLTNDAKADNEALEELLGLKKGKRRLSLDINPADTDFDFIYINGAHTLNDPHNKIHLIEETFQRLMFDTVNFESLS